MSVFENKPNSHREQPYSHAHISEICLGCSCNFDTPLIRATNCSLRVLKNSTSYMLQDKCIYTIGMNYFILFFQIKLKLIMHFLTTIIWFVFPIELSSQDLWSPSWVSLYMVHDCMGFNPIPLDVFQIFSLVKALVNGSARLSQNLSYLYI